ncbi:MAG: hypothetical protein WCQ21_31045 [Verrucomicrobiota bacterium]
MIAFEVYVNGEKVCTAGVGESGVLSSILTWRGTQPYKDGNVPAAASLELDVGGLTSPEGKDVRWAQRSIRVDDEIQIRVVEASAVDSPLKP